MHRGAAAKTHVMAVTERIVEVEAPGIIHNATPVEAGETLRGGVAGNSRQFFEFDACIEGIFAAGEGEVGEEFGCPFVVPARCGDIVVPVQTKIDPRTRRTKILRRFQPKIIGPVEKTEEHPISLTDAPIDLAVQVVKEVPWIRLHIGVLAVDGTDDGVDQEVQISPASTDHERSFVFHNGAFDHEFGCQNTHVCRAVHFPHVAVLHVDFQYR